MGYKNIWGITEGKKFMILSLVITACFVLFEARYNIDLLNALSNPNAISSEVDSLSQRGKLLASFGITWVFGRILITRIKPVIIGLGVFFACVVMVYFSLDHIYTKVIADLRPEVKVQGFNLFSYRRDLLTGKLSDPDLPLPKDDPVQGKILMGSFPIVLLDDRFMLPAQDIVARKAGDKKNQILQSAAQQWPRYAQRMNELQNGYSEYINGSRKAYQYQAFGGLRKFEQQSGGLKPDPKLSRDNFLAMLRYSQHPKGRELLAAEAAQIGKRPDGSVVYAREVPYFMSRQGYMKWFESQAEAAKAAALPTTGTVESFNGIRDINAAVFLPPMAIITSLMSATTNAVTLVLLLASLALSAVPKFSTAALWMKKLSTPFMVLIVAGIVLLMPSHVFRQGTPLFELETTMHHEVGLAGQVWSRLSGIQANLLK